MYFLSLGVKGFTKLTHTQIQSHKGRGGMSPETWIDPSPLGVAAPYTEKPLNVFWRQIVKIMFDDLWYLLLARSFLFLPSHPVWSNFFRILVVFAQKENGDWILQLLLKGHWISPLLNADWPSPSDWKPSFAGERIPGYLALSMTTICKGETPPGVELKTRQWKMLKWRL